MEGESEPEAAQKARTGVPGAWGAGEVRGEVAVRSSVCGILRHTERLERAQLENSYRRKPPALCCVCVREHLCSPPRDSKSQSQSIRWDTEILS